MGRKHGNLVEKTADNNWWMEVAGEGEGTVNDRVHTLSTWLPVVTLLKLERTIPWTYLRSPDGFMLMYESEFLSTEYLSVWPWTGWPASTWKVISCPSIAVRLRTVLPTVGDRVSEDREQRNVRWRTDTIDNKKLIHLPLLSSTKIRQRQTIRRDRRCSCRGPPALPLTNAQSAHRTTRQNNETWRKQTKQSKP